MRLLAIPRDGAMPDLAGASANGSEDVVAASVRLYEQRGFEPPWTGYLGLEDRLVVGACGFAAPPALGEVELAYFSFPGHEGRGVATRMVRALIDCTCAAAARARLAYIAHTLPRRDASTAILRKLGFKRLGALEHPDDGLVWKWRLMLNAPSG